MKIVGNICKDISESMLSKKEIVCSHVSTPTGIMRLQEPIISTEKQCDWCEGEKHYTPLIDPKVSDDYTWLCANTSCDVYTKFSDIRQYIPTHKDKRAVVWPLFCEINNIGDNHHNVLFEDIKQSENMKSHMSKFASSPTGIILMQGDKGTGKTYSSMAICEFYTRTDTSALFTTHKQMFNNWMETFKSDNITNYINKVTRVNLLVIDDFGISEVSPGFMSFFMDLINTRLQWSNRGTIITTNLDDTKFSNFCGDALSDRINTGLKFSFKGQTRRKQIIL